MTEHTIPEVTDRDVYLTRSFDAPVDVVWKFWTQPELLAQWFGPHGISVPADSVTVDAREGGSWNLTMTDSAGAYPIRATITKLVPKEYLEMVMESDTSEGFLDNEILRIRFHDHGDKTRMTLHQGPFTPEFRDMTRDGWSESFLKLDAILAEPSLAPLPESKSKSEPEQPAIHTVTSADGTRIAYETVGSGPALVLVDGALCYREFGPCRSLAKHLADRFTVYFYDRRGRGDSGDTRPYAAEREYEDLEAVIAAAGGDAYVAGFSSGAALALQAAASGVAMRKLASYEAPYVGKKGAGAQSDYLGHLNELIAKGDRDGAVGFFMVKMVGGPAFLPLMMRLMPKVWKQLKGVAHTLPYDATVMGSFDVPAATLAKVTVPTLVMGGSKAKPNMTAAVHGVTDAVPGAVQKTLAGQTHQVADAAIAPELRAFFTD